jgi:uncharacterized membrane protein YoaK (UPF0700 family)
VTAEVKAVLRAIAIVIGIAALVAAFLFLRSCASAPAVTAAATAKIQQESAETFTAAARDATAITGNTLDAVAAIDRQTETSHETIAHGDGSNRTAVSALCLRAAYRDQPRCAALLKAGAGATGTRDPGR